ncbi:MAG TPA: hypothetical protein VJW17_13785, partial [Pyrinomonadaceae bacterium]|nr:hypothetical protein [Pyrinomonadaceae bacterium]
QFEQQYNAATNAAADVAKTIAQQTQQTVQSSVSTSASPSLSTTPALQKLRDKEKVDRLIDQKQYLEAIKLDPTNVIALMRYIEEKTLSGDYKEATKYFSQLRQSNDSGVGYAVYPEVAVAFEKLGQIEQAKAALIELRNRIAQDIGQGYGYLSRSQQLQWVDSSLKTTESLVTNKSVLTEVKSLRAFIRDRINALTTG